MSLINQVLKDLEKRHAGREVRGLSDSLRALPEERPRRAVVWAIVGVLALGMPIAAAAWWFLLRPRPPAAPQPAAPIAAHMPAPVIAPPAPVAAAPLAESAAAALAPTAPPAPVAAALSVLPPRVGAPSVQLARAQGAGLPAKPAPVSPAPGLRPAPRASAALSAGQDSPAQNQNAPRAVTRPQTPAPLVEAGAADASPTAEPLTTIDKQPRPLEPRALADAEFRRGMKLLQEAHSVEAERAFRAALAADATAETARQALLGLLLESGRRDEAETLLREGLAVNPRHSKFAMILARMQLDRGAQDEAIATLTSNLPNAQWDPEYLAMAGAVFSRAERHRDAADMYQAALRMGPNNALWNLGLGVALKGDGRAREAAAAFQRARDIGTLSPDLKVFAEQQLADLR